MSRHERIQSLGKRSYPITHRAGLLLTKSASLILAAEIRLIGVMLVHQRNPGGRFIPVSVRGVLERAGVNVDSVILS